MKNHWVKVTGILLVMCLMTIIVGCKESSVRETTRKSSSPTTVKTTQKSTVKKSSGTTTKNNTTAMVDSSGEVASEEPTDGDVPAEDEPPVDEVQYDMKGRTIKFLTWATGDAQANPKPNPNNKVVNLRYTRLKEAEQLYNCKFEFVEATGGYQKILAEYDASILSGVYAYDAYRYHRLWLPKYEKMNAVLPLNEYINFDQPVWKVYNQINGVLYPENIYSFFECTPSYTHGVWYNTDVLNREGIPDLKVYTDNGNWNWDTFLDVCSSTTRDTNGDGFVDIWGLVTNNVEMMGMSMLFSNGITLVNYDETNGFTYGPGHPAGLKALHFMSDLYNVYKVIPNGNGENAFKTKKAALFIRESWYGIMFNTSWHLKDIRFVEMPLGPDNPGNMYIQVSSQTQGFFFPSSLSDPEPVVKAFAHWQCLWDDSKGEYATYDDVVEGIAEQTMFPEDIEYYKALYAKPVKKEENVDYFQATRAYNVNQVFAKLITREVTAATAIEAVRSPVEAIIRDILTK